MLLFIEHFFLVYTLSIIIVCFKASSWGVIYTLKGKKKIIIETRWFCYWPALQNKIKQNNRDKQN